MKRPSTLIFAFVLAVAGIFVAYGLGRLFFRAIIPTEVEVEEDDEPQLYNYNPQNTLIEFSPKIASPADSNKPIKE